MQAHSFAALTHLYIRIRLKGSHIGTAAMSSLASIRHENLVEPTFYTTAEALTTVHDAQSRVGLGNPLQTRGATVKGGATRSRALYQAWKGSDDVEDSPDRACSYVQSKS